HGRWKLRRHLRRLRGRSRRLGRLRKNDVPWRTFGRGRWSRLARAIRSAVFGVQQLWLRQRFRGDGWLRPEDLGQTNRLSCRNLWKAIRILFEGTGGRNGIGALAGNDGSAALPLVLDGSHLGTVRQRPFADDDVIELHDRALGKLEANNGVVVLRDGIKLRPQGIGPDPLGFQQDIEGATAGLEFLEPRLQLHGCG